MVRAVELTDRCQPSFHFSPAYRWAQQPGTQQTRTHAGDSLIDNVQQRAAACDTHGLNQLQVSHRNVVEHQMILRLKVDQITDVRTRRRAAFLALTQTRSGGANRFSFPLYAVPFECAHPKLLAQDRSALLRLPVPVVNWRQNGVE